MAKILIVEDSEVVRLELEKILLKAGHTVVSGTDGTDGLEKAIENQDIKLVITDLNMPRMDGITMSREIKKIPAFASLPVFMLTTESSPTLKSEGKAAGVILWIVKPFNEANVVAVIEKVLSR